ncbi:lysoplasmalogenase family protein [Mesoflavibacter zeaxanthinifaciens]|jgi:uncharacterized membrane protein YhhN|uniref:Lysoplasmalogenase n=1 Tax=Mesoflavibacter zeaxanthinifaciens subsp. sabulilitoris TaxID=1520893 RepID=A0A2T1NKS7_9FLAO|nr:lysoplasmalogenase family protein [Mesoflavibacter zeaxanthinifaciens]PSG93460.1 hypothetical protein C7H61_02810 [Mesoflavibacter zeaxanthinifaciens subsp. sabulilitoris]
MTAFVNIKYFTFVYFFILFLDIIFKNISDFFYVRIFTKLSLVTLLIVFFFQYNKPIKLLKDKIFLAGLFAFLLGDFFLIFYEYETIYLTGLFCFMLGKIAYTVRFSNQKDFKIKRLFPFLTILFIYIVFIATLVFDNLGDFFIPVLLYFFVSMLIFLFAYLRYDVVNSLSFYLVFAGVVCSVFSDSISVLQSFYNQNFGLNQYSVMLFYGLFQYLVVLGIIKETVLINE